MSIAEKLQTISDNMKKVYEAGQNNDANTYLLITKSGQEIPATFVDAKTVFNATENDIRKGTVAATDKGVTMGTKVIPSYHTTKGYKIITNGSQFQTIAFTELELQDFSKFQAIICPYNNSIAKSVSVEKVAINEGVYAVNSTELLAKVTKDSVTKTINLGITNNSGSLYVLRYFTYKEID